MTTVISPASLPTFSWYPAANTARSTPPAGLRRAAATAATRAPFDRSAAILLVLEGSGEGGGVAARECDVTAARPGRGATSRARVTGLGPTHRGLRLPATACARTTFPEAPRLLSKFVPVPIEAQKAAFPATVSTYVAQSPPLRTDWGTKPG